PGLVPTECGAEIRKGLTVRTVGGLAANRESIVEGQVDDRPAESGTAPLLDERGAGEAVSEFPRISGEVGAVGVGRRPDIGTGELVGIEEKDVDERLRAAKGETRPLDEAARKHHGDGALVLILDVNALERAQRAIRGAGPRVERHVGTGAKREVTGV